MVTITDAAADKIKEILTAEGKPGWGLRIFAEGSGCCGPSFGMDIEEKAVDGDEVVEKNGLSVFMDKPTSQNLSDKEIDYVTDGDDEGFVIKGTGPSACNCSGGCSE